MLNEKIIKIKNRLYSEKIEKTGKNSFQNFNFFELKDFLPKLIQFMNEEEINDQFTIENNEAILILNYKEEKNTYKIPFVMFDTPLNKAGKESMQPIQYLGALNTYYKRYLYLNAFSISENDVIDAMDKDEAENKNDTKNIKRDSQIKFIKQHQKEYQSFISGCLKKINKQTIEELSDEQIEKIKNSIAEKLANRNKEGGAQ